MNRRPTNLLWGIDVYCMLPQQQQHTLAQRNPSCSYTIVQHVLQSSPMLHRPRAALRRAAPAVYLIPAAMEQPHLHQPLPILSFTRMPLRHCMHARFCWNCKTAPPPHHPQEPPAGGMRLAVWTDDILAAGKYDTASDVRLVASLMDELPGADSNWCCVDVLSA